MTTDSFDDLQYCRKTGGIGLFAEMAYVHGDGGGLISAEFDARLIAQFLALIAAHNPIVADEGLENLWKDFRIAGFAVHPMQGGEYDSDYVAIRCEHRIPRE